MKAYWIRMLGAYLLLHFASKLVKDAEKTLTTTAHSDIIDSTASSVPETLTTEGPTEVAVNG